MIQDGAAFFKTLLKELMKEEGLEQDVKLSGSRWVKVMVHGRSYGKLQLTLCL